MNIRAFFTLLLGGLFTDFAFAGGGAILDSAGQGQEHMRLEYDGPYVRMSMPGQADTYMILRDGRMYSVINQDGQPMVISMNGMMRRLGGMAGQQNMLGDKNLQTFVSLEPTGGSEKIAGVNGKVYQMTYIDRGGNQHTETLVLSSDTRAREMTRAFMLMSTTMMDAMQSPRPEGREKFEAKMEDQGLLRYGDSFRVVAFEDDTPDASRFVLPAEPTRLSDFGINMKNGRVASTTPNGSSEQAGTDSNAQEKTGLLGKIFSQKAERQQDRQESRADSAVDNATDKAIDKALDKVFGIFD